MKNRGRKRNARSKILGIENLFLTKCHDFIKLKLTKFSTIRKKVMKGAGDVN